MSHNVTEAESGRARKEYYFKMLLSSDHESFISLSLENELSLLDIINSTGCVSVCRRAAVSSTHQTASIILIYIHNLIYIVSFLVPLKKNEQTNFITSLCGLL